MRPSRLVLIAGLAVTLSAVCGGAFGQEEPSAPAPTEEAEKTGFFGDRIALFVEVMAGLTDVDPYNVSIETSADLQAISSLDFADHNNVKAAIGWQLPYERGNFELVFEGYQEDGYRLSSEGLSSSLAPGNSPSQGPDPLLWWTLTAADGSLAAQRFPPSWSDPEDDANGDGEPQQDEVRYPDEPDQVSNRTVVTTLENNFQTYDLLYRRDFGTRRFRGEWSAGGRYFLYEGNVLATAWIGRDAPGTGFTEGSAFGLITMSQRSAGGGPTGSLAFVTRLFRERLQIVLDGRLAFVIQSLETDSGRFYTLTRRTIRDQSGTSQGAIVPAPARISKSLDKDVWQLMGTFAIRVRIIDGLSFRGEYFAGAYQDAVLLPSSLLIPSFSQIDDGSASIFNTQDIRLSGWRAGFRYQF